MRARVGDHPSPISRGVPTESLTRRFSAGPRRFLAPWYFAYLIAEIIIIPLAGWLARRSGSRRVFRLGLALRIAGFAVLVAVTLMPHRSIVAALGFVLIMLGWPVLSVSGTGFAAQLTSIGEGAAMGLLAASNATATVFGTFLGGPLVEALGYKVVPLIALVGLLAAEMVMSTTVRRFAADP
jgi:MFS family permease